MGTSKEELNSDLLDKINEIVSKLTIEEKASLCSGRDVWHTKAIRHHHIPSMLMTDGPHGIRKQTAIGDNIGLFESAPATCYPTASALAATWNKELIREIGEELSDECNHENINMLLGPGINIKRSPLCGRNFEYFSEDPFLTSELAIPMIKGIQKNEVAACLKHFAVNNQEKFRMTIDAIVDERALHEIYLYAFEKTIKFAEPKALMVSYNMLNGYYTSENSYLLNTILRESWNYKGVVVTDWGATNNRVFALSNGVDLEMPSTNKLHDPLIINSIKNKILNESELDKSVKRILNLVLSTQKAENRYVHNTVKHLLNGLNVKEQHSNAHQLRQRNHELAHRAASEAIVLLKNENKILPLNVNSKIAIIGQFAKHPRYQGAGSSKINPFKLDNLYHFAKHAYNENLLYAKGYSLTSDTNDQTLIDEAKDAALMSDIVVIMAGLPDSYESEGFDRTHIKLPPSHNFLIEEIAKINPNIIVVLSNGAPVEMPWANKTMAIVEAYLSGQAGGSALWDCLTGKTNPSGKLAETFPVNLEKTGAYHYYPMGPDMVDYRESIFVGYRYYDMHDYIKSNFKDNVLFPFGHGLSYTTFKYTFTGLHENNFDISKSDSLSVSFEIENTGAMAGMETTQLYVSYNQQQKDNSIIMPFKELKGFEKIFLNEGEKKIITILLDHSSFSYYDKYMHNWQVKTGNYNIMIGSSSKDIRITIPIFVTDNLCNTPFDIQAGKNSSSECDINIREHGNSQCDINSSGHGNSQSGINSNEQGNSQSSINSNEQGNSQSGINSSGHGNSQSGINSGEHSESQFDIDCIDHGNSQFDILRDLDDSLERDSLYFQKIFGEVIVSREEFYKFLERDFPKFPIHSSKFSRNSTLEDACKESVFCRLLLFLITYKIKSYAKGNSQQIDMMKRVLLEMPLRGLVLMSYGKIGYKMLDFLVLSLNKKYWQAIKHLFVINPINTKTT